jgi:propanol-preferring alcohol dehydrogenase
MEKDVLLQLDYPRHLWLEKEIKSVANVTGKDVNDCLQLAAEFSMRPEVQEFTLEETKKALVELKEKKFAEQKF